MSDCAVSLTCQTRWGSTKLSVCKLDETAAAAHLGAIGSRVDGQTDAHSAIVVIEVKSSSVETVVARSESQSGFAARSMSRDGTLARRLACLGTNSLTHGRRARGKNEGGTPSSEPQTR